MVPHPWADVGTRARDVGEVRNVEERGGKKRGNRGNRNYGETFLSKYRARRVGNT